MPDLRFLFKPQYATSRALVIGIDEYKTASPLAYAVSDARAMRDALIRTLGFEAKNVQFLTNAEATRHSIARAFLGFESDEVELDDRIVVFFAGHGHTKTGIRGEIGFLVPHDADMNDMSTLIRWDELTRNSEMIRAKHILFIMDACYGGLALTRQLQTGSVRFLKDMLRRYSRQVLTAGKGDEVVSDSGGPLPDHSIFTGHLIQGLEGAAANEHGVLTANGLMSYVYRKVATDLHSHQTPHYGYFDGDGDFIISAPFLTVSSNTTAQDIEIDEFYSVPVIAEEPSLEDIQSKIARVKRLLGDESATIELHDMMIREVKNFLLQSGEDYFVVDEPVTTESLQDRMTKYERISSDLCALLSCIAYWAKETHRTTLRKVLSRSTDRLEPRNGSTAWINLRWYPMILELYSAGIAAVEGGRYDSLRDILYAPSASSASNEKYPRFAASVVYASLELTRLSLFKMLPGHEQLRTPMSEYLHKLLQPRLDDTLFLGTNYEHAFDEFEVLLALVIAVDCKSHARHVWGPIGRFGWKVFRSTTNPLQEIVELARTERENWAPFKAGIFGPSKSPTMVIDAINEFTTAVGNLGWY